MLVPFLPLLTGAAPSQISPSDLRVNYAADPIGIDDAHPRFFWLDKGNGRNLSQTAYRIVVASSLVRLKAGVYNMWDSGKVMSDAMTQIPYDGTALAPGQKVWWQVQIWDQKGNASHLSAPASWELGLPSASDWQASWISLPTRADDPLDIPSPYFRRAFSVNGPLISARVYASAKGLYEMSIDGRKVGLDHLDPGWTDYRKRIQYQTYDITSLLKGRSHAIGFRLGNGWYCGHVGLTGGDNYGKNPELIAQIVLTYEDGHKDTIATDGSWKASTGSITSNDLLMGESEDARLEPIGWDRAGFNDSAWNDVKIDDDKHVPLVAQTGPTVQVLQEITPIALVPQTNPDVYVVDMGQNMVGWTRLKVQGPAGTKIQLRFAEMLNPDKSVYTTNLRGAKATDHFILSGNGEETFEPAFTTHGFRYVEIRGYPGEFHADAIRGIVAGSNNPITGGFECSSPLVNKLQHNIFWGERGNYLSIPTDCPQRDERLGWMGDAQIFVRNATYNNDIAGFMDKWTQDQVDAQSAEGGFSDVSPRKGDPSDGAPAWGDAGVIVPYTIYRVYGDKHLLSERYPAMRHWIEYIDSVNPDHIWIKRSNNNFGDWLNVHDDTPRDVLATAYFAYSTSLVADSARVLGMTEDAEKYQKLYEEIRRAFNEKFVTDDYRIKGDTQTDYVIALRFGLVPENMRETAAKHLVDHIMIDRKGHLSTGFVGVGYLNPTLTSMGYTEVAYKLLLNDTYPSWGYSIKQGATTIWERWDGWTQDKGFQDPGMNSFNHYSLGSVGEWMFRTVGGIDLSPTEPGFKQIVIHPIPGGGMTWAKAHYDSVNGRIESSWTLSGKKFDLSVTVPPNTTAKVYLPKSPQPVLEGGKDVRGLLRPATSDDPKADAYVVGSGSYRFTAWLP